jgi:hypothetical protein
MVENVRRCALYVLLLLSMLCFCIVQSSEKNIMSITNNISVEIKNPGHGTAETFNIPVTEPLYKPGLIFEIGTGEETLLREISPVEAKNQSFIGYDLGAPTYDIQNIATNVTFRGTTSDDILAVDDISHYFNLSGSFIPIFAKDNMNGNGDGNINAAYDQVSPQSSRANTYKYTIVQPVSPPLKSLSPNTSYLGERSHYVGADGHKITLMNNGSAVDPSYKQLVEFIKQDKTNEIMYNNTSFVCSDAAERVHNNAENYGFKSAWVYVDFANERTTINPETNALVVGHSCNLFNTTDRGLVAIDCTGGSIPIDNDSSFDFSKWDNEVSLIKNGEYTPRLLYSFPGSEKLKPFVSMGTIADYCVFW